MKAINDIRGDIFERGSKELFENKILTKEEKFKLLDLCYKEVKGKEFAFRRFLTGAFNLFSRIKLGSTISANDGTFS